MGDIGVILGLYWGYIRVVLGLYMGDIGVMLGFRESTSVQAAMCGRAGAPAEEL